MAERPRILIVDDEPSIGEVLRISLSKDGYAVEAFDDPRKALERFRARPHDLVIQDLKMPQMDGLELLREIKSAHPDALVVIMTAYSTWERAVEAMRMGAFDYIKKPFDTNLDVRATVARAMRLREVRAAHGGSVDDAFAATGMMIGDSAAMKAVRALIRRAAPTDSSVLVEGESGVGKELCARALHFLSGRAGGPFVTVNCSAIPETLLESELFGHVKGAFTGAVVDKQGLVETARGGTFFLDEISEMAPSLQAKLLRVLEERQFKAVGSVETKTIDVRFVAATNRNLEEEVKHGRFRKDLFYRLNVIPIRIPPLRERKEDIALLGGFFLRKYGGARGVADFSAEGREALLGHSWPGNVRELENCVERAVTLCEGRTIQAKDLFEGARPKPDTAVRPAPDAKLGPDGLDLDVRMGQIEVEYLKKALEHSGGSYTKAAQILKMSLRSFRYRLEKYGLDRGDRP